MRGRLAIGYKQSGFVPEYPTFPFRPEAFADLKHDTPREILKKCEAHRQQCIRAGAVVDLTRSPRRGTSDPGWGRAERSSPCWIKSSPDFVPPRSPTSSWRRSHEDERLAPLLQTALECLLHEKDLPPNIGSLVDTEFTGGATTRPLHARLRLIYQDEHEREEHYCVRAIQLTNAKAYQSRLKAAMTQSGIDRTLKFRRLSLVRTKPTPGGAETQKLTEKFENAGGIFLKPTEEELEDDLTRSTK